VRTSGQRVSKILVIMEENHSIDQVFPSHMPYLWSLAQRYGRATAWTDVSHPSLPNYLAIFAGSIFDNPQDCGPATGCQYSGPTVFGQALAAGRTARAYEESMPTPCNTSFSGEYDVNHNPWAYFPDEASQCARGDVPAGTASSGAFASDVRAGTLPDVGLLTPNLMHDGHDGTLAQADAFLLSWLPPVLAGPDWLAGRLAVVVVFDEGETIETVPFVILAPGVSGVVLTTALDHYSLTRLIDQVAGVAPLRNAASRPSLAVMLGLKL
jgi:phospholipase C